MRHIIFIGCGTGRSGTVTLSKILDRCRGFHCTHESDPMLPWDFNEETYEYKKQLLLDSFEDIGDVHSVYLPYLERFIKDVPDIKIVCTRRNSEEVAASFEKHIDKGPAPNRNHWHDHKGSDGWQIDPIWDPTFPKYKIKNRKQAIIKYANDYNQKIDKLKKIYPENIMIVQVSALSTLSGQNKIFKFAGIKPLNRRYTRKGHSVHNKS